MGQKKKLTNVDEHFEQLRKNPEFRAEYMLLDVAESLAGQIRDIREMRALSQVQLAEILSTRQSHVSRLEDPLYARYSMLTLAKVADALNCRLDVKLVPQKAAKMTLARNSHK